MFSTVHAKRSIEEFERIRAKWIEILLKNPRSIEAAQHILSINSKIELLEIIGYRELLEEEEGS